MLTDSEVAAMRSTADMALPDTIIIGGPTVVSDGRGGGTTTFVASGTVDCRIVPVSSSGDGESVEGGRVHPDTEYVVTLPAGTDITSDDRLTFGSQTFTVTALRDPLSWQISRRVEVKEVD